MKYIIESRRNFENFPSWHLVYEWEDIFAKKLCNSKFHYNTKFEIFFNRIIGKIGFFNGNFLSSNNLHITFDLGAKMRNNLFNRKNVIPIIIDYFLTDDQLDRFEKAYKRNKIVFVSSKEVYDYLITKSLNLNLKHLALSLSDKYQIDKNVLKYKKYDCVLFGRVNKVLKEFLIKYAEKHPSITYVIRGNKDFEYYTNKGEYVGYLTSRDSYINIMKQSKIALYSTPGMDNSRVDANGFNQVTPKFLEYIYCGCHLILRYPKNSDTDYFELNKFGPSVNTYEDFEILMDRYLRTDPPLDFYTEYLSHHYTSVRVNQFKEIIKDYE